ncbi:MAG: RagB/SusD family nutrient uptake outer membrane protein [Flavobacteriaceae bacterium]|jgi:hypothetical protein|nr:RagB/SusD family nutrient uptake outer membrane protein [Flavobacteriaceae bacterium]
MKRIFKYLTIVALSLVAISCQDEFLETSPTETISNPSTEQKLYGIYVMMINTGTGGTNLDHDDFGQKGYDIYTDMLSSDMVLAASTYGWYARLCNLSDPVNNTTNTCYKPWRYYYRVIAAANDVIADLGGNDAVLESQEDKYIMGQAKALRAYAYFYLLQLYVKSYSPDEDAIPVYTAPLIPAQPKSTQSVVYNQIIKDLTESIDLLEGFSRANKGMINKYVAEGLLAYTYAAIGDYANAAQRSKNIIDGGGFPITTKAAAVGGGFNDLATPSWMWGFDLTTENGLDLVSWWGQVDLYTYSYAWAGDPKTMDDGLYNSMRTDDVRRGQFEDIYGIEHWPTNKFFAPDKPEEGGQRTITTDYVFMRVDEFYLLYAESLAKSGQEGTAKTILKDYLQNRLGDVSYIDALSGVALQNEIYLQTRIEFWGEGKSYLAMKRNKATITRGLNHLWFQGTSFSYDDNRLTLAIPQEEILNNPHF